MYRVHGVAVPIQQSLSVLSVLPVDMYLDHVLATLFEDDPSECSINRGPHTTAVCPKNLTDALHTRDQGVGGRQVNGGC